jgi:hypothetical protein
LPVKRISPPTISLRRFNIAVLTGAACHDRQTTQTAYKKKPGLIFPSTIFLKNQRDGFASQRAMC